MRRLSHTSSLLRRGTRFIRAGSRLEQRALLSALPQDITGNGISLGTASPVQQKQALVLLDEAIMNMITLEAVAAPTLRTLLKLDRESGIANALLALELLRHSIYTPSQVAGTVTTDAEIQACLSKLEANFAKITKRERFLGAAAAAWREGNYRRAGALLESAQQSAQAGDTLALRLAQDCYLAAGDSRNVLGCVARCLQMNDPQHLLHGHMLGMVALGYLETGRLNDAEEAATRAITRTNGRDIWAILTLLHTYQLTGRSSEIIATLDEHLEKHEGLGQQSLLFNKGCALAQRGNCRSALRVYDVMVDDLQSNDSERSASLLSQATFLLWQISLHEVNRQVSSRWPILASLWMSVATEEGGRYPPFVALSKTMALAAYRHSSSLLEADTDFPDQGQGQGRVSEEGGVTINLPEGGSVRTSDGGVEARPDMLRWVWESFQNTIRPAPRTSTADPATASLSPAELAAKEEAAATARFKKAADDAEALRAYVEKFFASSPSPTGLGLMTASVSTLFPNLHAIKATLTLAGVADVSSHLSAAAEGKSERDWTQATAGIPLGHALSSFPSTSEADLSRTVELLLLHQASMPRLGGTSVIRDVLEQTLIEALLRSGRFSEARLLLSERLVLSPNDAQAWRRQASVLGRLGLKGPAEVANYTAWQLGIGQGGFGGPR